MRLHQTTLEGCAAIEGMVVSVDVLRAFTTAAFAFDAGVRDIVLTGEVEAAFALRERFPGSRIMGEVGGLPVPGFDYDNSPSAMKGRDLKGIRLIQRTTAGTQGIVRSVRARIGYATSFVCAKATAACISIEAEPDVTLVITGKLEGRDGDEDAACAEYIAALLRGETPSAAPYLQRVSRSTAGQKFVEPGHPFFPLEDVMCAVDLDRFDFAMRVTREADGLVMRRVSSLDLSAGARA